ncbi:MAG TPA: zinc-dependent metalloprotease [Longimicrobium sp.]|jgi:hypothetical protein|uniref:zinc-dependent metalloprotease n=1 Tax=Longimicrobium sp. TaxID=2029185 RepID=UPI002EDB40BE
MRFSIRWAAVAALLLAPAVPAPAAAQAPLPSIADKTRGMERRDGFVPIYWDAAAGKLWMEVPRSGEELIYIVSLPAGLGSNDVGLDRGQIGGERLVRFDRVGPRVLLVQPNQAYRAVSEDENERRAVEQSFAQSVLWGFTVAAETDGRVLVDATDFVLRDAHGVIPALRRSRQGDYRLDASRSALYLQNTRGFPRNTEIEATLTFTGDNPGNLVRDVTPTPEAITLRQRLSFVALPPPGYQPRRSDPRAGFFGISYFDYATPVGEDIVQRFISRHRLEKRDPAAAMSEAVQPIVYYVDRGAPEPIRSALLDGARWWNQAFEAAGYRDAFRVELLPEGADPMDVRYNVIQWVHRSTRGWSYGNTVTDPRTGEIIKGHVTLGSLRVRQDYLIAEGLLAPYATGNERPAELERMALARIRQLAAHEVGHTLGLMHNYIASAQGRASVMDYPHPLVQLRPDGSIDLSSAYTAEIGPWDKVAITWGYRDPPAGTDGRAALDAVLADARARGLTLLTDQDARPAGSLSPSAHLWDNGANATAELRRVMAVRRVALNRFGENAVRAGRPLATLEEVLVPVYLHHRYQVEAASKVLAGVDYSYALRGDGQTPLRPVPATAQREALDALIGTLDPRELALPRTVLALIPPRPATYDPTREQFGRWTGLGFDALTPAVAAADLTVGMILNPERAARLVEQGALDRSLPSLEWTLNELVERTFRPQPDDAYLQEIDRAVERVVVDRLMLLAENAPMPQVRAIAQQSLMQIRLRYGYAEVPSTPATAHRALLASDITRFLERPYQPQQRIAVPDAPPGQPIGSDEEF